MKKSGFSILLALALSFALFLGAAAAVKGDADGDGSVTANDARTALRVAVGLDEVSSEIRALINVDGDENVTAADARLILRAAVGLEDLEKGTIGPHDHVWDDGEITAAPTCGSGGIRTYTCTVCGEKLEQPIPALASAHVWDEGAVTVAATAETAGLKTYTCTLCGATRTEKIRILGLDIPANNEYDKYRGQSFYITGTMFDGVSRSPMEIGVDRNVIYMRTELEGAPLAVQTIGSDLYIILPTKGTYYKMDKSTMEMIGMTEDDLIPRSQLNFTDMPSLWDADRVVEAYREGRTCKVYQFKLDGGYRVDVGMDGEKLVFTETYSPAGNVVDGMYFDSVSSTMPEKLKKPGAGNRRILLLTTFMAQLAEFIDF